MQELTQKMLQAAPLVRPEPEDRARVAAICLHISSEIKVYSEQAYSPETAHALILQGYAPREMCVDGELVFEGLKNLRLPQILSCRKLSLEGCSKPQLPEFLACRELEIRNCQQLDRLPESLQAESVSLEGLAIPALSRQMSALRALRLLQCAQLQTLPRGLKVQNLSIQSCQALSALPEGLQVNFLELLDCQQFRTWPLEGYFGGGHLSLRGCRQISYLPIWIERVAQLDLANCLSLSELPAWLKVSGWIDLADSGIESLPVALSGVPLRWKSVAIDSRIAFSPESISGQEILETSNLELRRVKMERKGHQAFIREIEPEVLDMDLDRGGPRQLLKVMMPQDEDLVMLGVTCPSTGHHYFLRVPPATGSCHQAAAWIAGFDDPEAYAPAVET